jgi:hypothetical protein
MMIVKKRVRKLNIKFEANAKPAILQNLLCFCTCVNNSKVKNVLAYNRSQSY